MTDNPFSILGEIYEALAVQTFSQWLERGRPGSKFVYATRHVLDKDTPAEVLADALLAKEAYAKGIVELIQLRTAPNGAFSYTAVMKRTPRKPLVNGVPWQVKIISPTYGYTSASWKER